MTALGAFLVAIAGSVATRVMLALGLGVITYSGLTYIADQIRAAALASWGQIPATVVQLLGLAGVGDAIGIILGAVAVKIALRPLSFIGRVVS